MNILRTIHLGLSDIRSTQKHLGTNWIINIANKGTWLCIIYTIIVLLWRWQTLPSEVPLWYFRPWGEERLAPYYFLFLLPVGSAFWHSINIYISSVITKEYLVFTQILFIVSLLVGILGAITVTKIILLTT